MPKKWQFISGMVATLARNSGNFETEWWQFCSGLCITDCMILHANLFFYLGLYFLYFCSSSARSSVVD